MSLVTRALVVHDEETSKYTVNECRLIIPQSRWSFRCRSWNNSLVVITQRPRSAICSSVDSCCLGDRYINRNGDLSTNAKSAAHQFYAFLSWKRGPASHFKTVCHRFLSSLIQPGAAKKHCKDSRTERQSASVTALFICSNYANVSEWK